MSTIIKAKIGFEEEFNSLVFKRNSLVSEKEEAIRKAVEEVEARYQERGELISTLLSMVSEPEEIADEAETEMEAEDFEEEQEPLLEVEGEETVGETLPERQGVKVTPTFVL